MGPRQFRSRVSFSGRDLSSKTSPNAGTISWFGGNPEPGARNCALIKFLQVPLPAHIHDSVSSGLEPRAHRHMGRVGGERLAHRLRVATPPRLSLKLPRLQNPAHRAQRQGQLTR